MQIKFVAADWGGSFLRVWLVDAKCRVVDAKKSERGAVSLGKEEFESVLLELINPWLPAAGVLPVVVCGMAGARNGWREAPYLAAPCAPSADSAVPVYVQSAAIRVMILPGISQQRPPDVMRGEETQIAGLLTRQSNFDGAVCLPGTHSKWVKLQQQKIVRFTTAMSGEIFSLLQRHSVLQQITMGEEWDKEAFAKGVLRAVEYPEKITADLFAMRAENLLFGLLAAAARARLSGLITGLEIAAMREYWSAEKKVALIADKTLGDVYADALRCVDVEAARYDGGEMALAGLVHYHQRTAR